MRLTTFSTCTLHVLTYLALHPDRFVTIAEIAQAHGMSANHLMKVVQHLAHGGDVVTLRGPRGGLRLARPAAGIRVGDVIRRTEPAWAWVPNREGVVQPDSGVPHVLKTAMAAFMAVLDGHTIADMAAAKNAVATLRASCDSHREPHSDAAIP